MIHSWVPDLIFPPALPWVHRAEVPVAVNHQILFSHYSVKSKRGRWFQKDLKNRFYLKDAVYFGHDERLIKFYSCFEKKYDLIIKMGSRFGTNVPFYLL